MPAEKPPSPYGAKSIAEVPINRATPAVINAVSTRLTESAFGNSRYVRKTYPKLSPNEQPQGPQNEDRHACQNYC